MTKTLPVFLFLLLCCTQVSGIDFNRDVRPILSDKCFACHGFDEHERKADLRLDTREGAMADLGGYSAIVPGNLEESEAWFRITTDDESDIMPPPKFHKPLTPEEKDILKKWIEEGAEYKTHWSYAALKNTEIPEGKSPVDFFIEKNLKERGLELSPEADRITLVRRLYFDLLGLPPSSAEVDEFVKDQSPDFYEKKVDELLGNPAFGERMAVYWLDLVRYADTIGYHSDNMMEVSAYRDYVIDAFNRNLSYDQFTIEQLAGDLLPDATLEQKIASGYNRLLQTTEEGGAQADEYMVIHAADRVRNVSGVWLGSTIGCAQCHDHKYDPFTARDFYTLAAFFADVKEKPIGKRQPNLKLPTKQEEEQLAQLNRELKEHSFAETLKRNPDLATKVESAMRKWEADLLELLAGKQREIWEVKTPENLKSQNGQKFKVGDDKSVVTSGPNPAKDNYTFSVEGSGVITAVRIEALTDQRFPRKSLSRSNGNFILSEFRVSHEGENLQLASAKADYEQKSWPVSAAIDGKNNSGWAVDGHVADKIKDRSAMFILAQPVNLGDGGKLSIELQHQAGHAGHNIGKFRVSLTNSINPFLQDKPEIPANITGILKKNREERTAAEKNEIAKFFHERTPLLAEAAKNQQRITKEISGINGGVRTMLVSESLPTPRVTRVLNRGDWLDKDGEIVEPTLPAFLPREKELPAERRGNRLDLAKWIVEPTNPLTARTMVNRMWMLFFGEGISRNVDDLGGQGEPPTHPELLDQLSVQFIESGWDIKALIKEILLSKSYRQISTPGAALAKQDPTNLLWGRQGRWRLDAEFVRDTALQLSGLLVEQQGGRSVKPYQPDGYWQHLNFPRRKWQAGNGDDLYRRGLYTFRCRSFPHPAMVSFDAPSREECTSKRSRSNIPQQALVMLNDPVFVEAARKFGDRMATAEGDASAKILFGWKEATGRAATAEEVELLKALFEEQSHKYRTREKQAEEFLSIGESGRDMSVSLPESAAWTQVARAILNVYETTSRN